MGTQKYLKLTRKSQFESGEGGQVNMCIGQLQNTRGFTTLASTATQPP